MSASLFLCPYLIAEHIRDVPVVSELGGVSAEQSISDQDGNSSQDERCKQVGVDVVSGAVKLTAGIAQATRMLNASQRFSHSSNVLNVQHFFFLLISSFFKV